MPSPGKYALIKEEPAHLVVAMTISPESAWRTLSLQYEIPDPNPPPLHHNYGKKGVNGQHCDSRQSDQRHYPPTPEMYPECVIASWDTLILLLDAENIE